METDYHLKRVWPNLFDSGSTRYMHDYLEDSDQ